MAVSPDLTFEWEIWHKKKLVAGLDEAGRGAWAGPVVAGAVILPMSEMSLVALHGVRDSKLMTPAGREYWQLKIKQTAICWGVGFASNTEVDLLGIVPATRLAMKRALVQLHHQPAQLLLDYIKLPEVQLPQQSLVKGDQISLSIACASVLAKTARDLWMTRASKLFPNYGFDHHKGYGTSTHRQNLGVWGLCELHRKSFRPIHSIESGCGS